MSITFGRLRATATAAVVALSVVALPAQSQAAVADPTGAAAWFLQSQLQATGHHLENYGAPDHGLTIDAILALNAAGTAGTEAAAATDFVASEITKYTGPAWGDTELYAGALGKALVLAIAEGRDPHAFGGQDLVAQLQSLMAPTGRFSDKSAYGDYSTMLGQSWDVLGLRRAGVDATVPASFIAGEQCADGGFPLYLGKEPCVSDPDATAFAVQALIAVRGAGDPAATKGLDYLAAKQAADGGVGGGVKTEGANANSTGLAGQAFLAGGRRAQATAAATWIKALQMDCAFAEAQRGGITYDATAHAERKADGAINDQERRATAQAMLALAGTPLFAVTASGSAAVAAAMTCETTPPVEQPVTPPVTTPVTPPVTTPVAPAVTAPTTAVTTAARAATTARPARLANTGADGTVPLTLGSGLVLAGLGLILLRRRGVRA